MVKRDAPKRVWTFAVGLEGRAALFSIEGRFRDVGDSWYDADIHARMLILYGPDAKPA